ncbi:MAG: hypothetical protein FWG06_00235 [Clostridiales bacterium]|nr:hypothetical protein [Clostridiales bacterium]
MRVIERCIDDAAYSVWATLTLLDKGANVCLGGGQSHVGAIVLALPRESLLDNGSISCTTSVINVLGHKDDLVALPVAEKLCRELDMPVTVTAGIHIDKATAADIERLQKNVLYLAQLLCNDLRDIWPAGK